MADIATYKAARKRDGGACVKCSSTKNLQTHHIQAQADGGSDDIGNLVTLCSLCHQEWHLLEQSVDLKFDHWRNMPPVGALYISLCMIDWPDEYKELQQHILTTARELCKLHNNLV